LEKITSFLIIFKETVISITRWIDRHNGFVTAIATVFIAAFTLALIFANRKLWKVSREHSKHLEASVAISKEAADAATNSAKVAETALHVAERAYLRINNFEVVNFRISQHLNIRYEIHNVGHTPAEIIESLTIVDVVPKAFFKTPGYDIDKAFIGPKEAFI